MILLIDNYDSFVHNLGRYVGMAGRERRIVRNDVIEIMDIAKNPPEAIIISPGPCTPNEAGQSNEIIRQFGTQIPILGVCLGHQCIGEVYGGRVVRAEKPMHGRSSKIKHNSKALFQDIPDNIDVGRYHSLIVDMPSNSDLNIDAQTDDGIIMAFSHKTHSVYGIQFHPESCLTDHGLDILQNFLLIADQWNSKRRAA